ncbi:unnamed protein product [Bursaphelenchus okinawaensis]|uniref:Fatty acid desaturase domain-containing protein n=1 Tax=Bursaphelenchus okinawaensis TaxID=465554 RepID=A0A811KVY1_9BILA|nr:unnamed protein product [Bursaphelenchus okinawaensis]CAG9112296.1 unnamed protein product [Bursaphelenchus okinawaensis]
MVAAAPSQVGEDVHMAPSVQKQSEVQKPQPPNLPTLEELRKAIPPECFEKDWRKSMFFLVWDYAVIAGLYYALPYIEQYGGWPGLLVWYYVVGMFGFSLFVVGHDCGHGTFSEYTWLNDIIGHVAHAPILAPYWPWQKSHRQHHQYTSHLEKDKGHPWYTQEEYVQEPWVIQQFFKFPLSAFVRWNFVYLTLGLPDGSHYWPYSKLFKTTEDRVKCAVSTSLCIASAYVAFVICDYSFSTYVKYYLAPVLFQGLWLVMVTYLQHQDEEIEVYEDAEWSFVRGQTQTIDRTYGMFIDTLMHHITDGHVAHHLFFTKIPHYHLIEATEGIKKVFKKYPGLYKKQNNFLTLLEFLRLNVRLDYLLGRGTGVLRYHVSKFYNKNKTE